MEKDHNELNLIIKELFGEIANEERVILEEWLQKDPDNRYLYEEVKDREKLRKNLELYEYAKSQKGQVYSEIMEAFNRIDEPEKPIEPVKSAKPIIVRFRRRRYMAAAVILGVVSTAIAFFFVWNPFSKKKPPVTETNHRTDTFEVPASHLKATLTLADNTTIALDKSLSGKLAEQDNTAIYNENGKVVYNMKTTVSNSDKVLYNKLSTHYGQTYPLELADGSKVWLNAGSSIRYPVAFTGNERIVHVTGEAYFEVAPLVLQSGQKIPFRVHIDNTNGKGIKETVEVLGTKFNINAYDNEGYIKTTLLEGSVKVRSFLLTRSSHTWQNSWYEGGNAPPEVSYDAGEEALLKPGQQAILAKHNNSIVIKKEVNVENVVAWKNGHFHFDNDDLRTIMRQVERWYDVDVIYLAQIPNNTFIGEIICSDNLPHVLKILENISDLQFILHNKTITIKSKIPH
jgi:transmembrane sensor